MNDSLKMVSRESRNGDSSFEKSKHRKCWKYGERIVNVWVSYWQEWTSVRWRLRARQAVNLLARKPLGFKRPDRVDDYRHSERSQLYLISRDNEHSFIIEHGRYLQLSVYVNHSRSLKRNSNAACFVICH